MITYYYCFNCRCNRHFLQGKCVNCGYELNIYDKLKGVLK